MGDENARFVRWQQVTIAYFGYCVNLILTLSIAALAYALSIAKDTDFLSSPARGCLGILLTISLVGLSVSVVCGLLCILNRLRDFRGTAQRAKNSTTAPPKEELDQLGKITWRLFYAQAWTFLVSIVSTAVVVACVRVPRIFAA